MMLAFHNAIAPTTGARARLGQRSQTSALTSTRTAGRPTLVVARSDGQNSQNTQDAENIQDAQKAQATEVDKAPRSQEAVQSGSRLQTPEKEDFIKGQGTAIVTGAISIIFGIAYLALVSLLDVRGGELLPPPPEACLNQ